MAAMTTPTPSVDVDFSPAAYPPEAFSYAVVMQKFGLSKAAAKRAIAELKAHEVVRSSTHQVARIGQAGGRPGVVWLTIKRRDRSPILDRRELAWIAAALIPETVAIELLPVNWRVVDTANQYHVFGFPLADLPALLGQAPQLVTPPHLGCWRALQSWKEAAFPGREAALILNGPPNCAERVLVAPSGVVFPVGFTTGAVRSDATGGAVQRPIT